MSEILLGLLAVTAVAVLIDWRLRRRRGSAQRELERASAHDPASTPNAPATAQHEAERPAPALQEPQRLRAAAEALQAERELQAARQAEADRAEAERAERERLAAAAAAAQQARREAELAQAERAAAERAAAEHAEAERIAAERAAVERAAAERAEAERAAAERAAAERAAAQRLAAERAAAERLAAERAEAQRAQAERVQAERAQAERAQAERLAAAQAERERLIAAEQAAAHRRLAAQRSLPATPQRHAPQRSGPARVLVADDSKVVRIKTGRLLAQHDCQVDYAADGLDAWRQLQDRLPDLVITDVEMPGMDGFELTRHIRADARSAQLPVIMITAADERHRDQAEAAGVSVLLGKPYADEELLAQLRRALGQPADTQGRSATPA